MLLGQQEQVEAHVSKYNIILISPFSSTFNYVFSLPLYA